MPLETTPDVLVVLDEHPSSRAGLRIAERYARGIVALAAWHTATGRTRVQRPPRSRRH